MKTNYKQLLINKRRELGLCLIDMARKVGVSMTALHNYEQGLNVSDSSEEKLIAFTKGFI